MNNVNGLPRLECLRPLLGSFKCIAVELPLTNQCCWSACWFQLINLWCSGWCMSDMLIIVDNKFHYSTTSWIDGDRSVVCHLVPKTEESKHSRVVLTMTGVNLTSFISAGNEVLLEFGKKFLYSRRHQLGKLKKFYVEDIASQMVHESRRRRDGRSLLFSIYYLICMRMQLFIGVFMELSNVFILN